MCKLGFLLLFSFVMINSIFALDIETPGSYVPGELILKLADNSHPVQLENEYRFANLKFERNLSSRLHIWLVSFNSKMDEYSILKQLKGDNRILLVQFNHYIEERETPDDTMFPLQWNMHNTGQSGGVEDADIDAPEAWDINVGGVCANGDTVVIAIVDSGCDILHDDINFWKNDAEIPGNGIDDDNNGYIDDYDGWNAVSHSGVITTSSHGTHVAGIAAARGDNALGVTGVNWHAKVLPIRGSTSLESVAVEAYSYVHELRSTWNESNGSQGAFVVATNSSFGVNYGNPDNFPIWVSMYNEMGEIGILSATATMNINANVDEVGDMPTSCDSEYMISVTNTTDEDMRYNDAAYGLTTIDLGAPGTAIRSTNYNNSYSNKTGTSMSTPHVAGAIAYLISAAPLSFLNNYLENPAESALLIRDYILNGVDPLTDLEGETVTGGRLNIYNSLLMFEPPGESGEISQDTSWGGNINVVGDITIADGVTLTINAGSQISFAENFKIDVQGRILALGTMEDRIEFSPADSLLGWGGLRFNQTPVTNDSTLFYYTDFIQGFSDESGGAIHANYFSKIRLESCFFQRNKAQRNGGAISLEESDIHIENCDFEANLAYGGEISNGGAIALYESEAKILGCTFTNNLAGSSGGALYFSVSESAIIENSSFESNIANYNGGAIGADLSILEIKQTIFKGNLTSQYTTQNSGGAFNLDGCNVNIVNNLFINNSSSSASVMMLSNSLGLFINNTFSNNNCPDNDNNSVILIDKFLDIQPLEFINNIIWNNGINTDFQIRLLGNFADPDFLYNNIENGIESIWVEEEYEYEGLYENNIDADPEFIEDNPHDYALTQQSPSVNTGMPDMSEYDIPELDLAGNPRIFEGLVTRIDQGCYEYQGDNVRAEHSTVPYVNSILSIYPNPFNPSTTINFNIQKNMLVKIEIFNLKGQKVKTVLNEKLESGNHSLIWNGSDNDENPVASGIYFSKMEVSDKVSIKKMILLK